MLKYRLITGPDDSSFCQRISDLLDLGYQLHGSPSITFNTAKNSVIAAQALIWRESVAEEHK
ncbi:DUF1737 domain-containing protein [Robbsia sp. Bb-Pol-6]|uniref:DUF1737 domain-containing protein n=1 Tax=Robbsia betulipollinis TaxID=2981849 RepID=A0ABT3ZTJ1_9BURK|nr:DUF1737 domain-containing protein [Robbsia betulipollinis]MCY0389884.1 DUF1737 domain-containing protein [Robbsia betulipollinis]